LERRDPGADEEAVDRDAPDTAGPGHDDLRAVDEQRRSRVGCRRGVADVAGQRGAVADLDRSDDRRSLGQRTEVELHTRVGRDIGHDGRRPDDEAPIGLADPRIELGDRAGR
jgi:hypothetical protein